MPPLHEDELSIFCIKTCSTKDNFPAVVLVGITAEREIGCKRPEGDGVRRGPPYTRPLDPVQVLMPDSLQLVFQKLDSEFAFGGVEPVGVRLA